MYSHAFTLVIIFVGMLLDCTSAREDYPDAADGVILDSVLPPGSYLSDFADQYDRVGKDLGELCAANAECGARLGPKPWARVTELLAKLDQGHCPYFQKRSLLRDSLAQLVMFRARREYLFPLVYRLDRCELEDVSVVEHFLDFMPSDPLRSPDVKRGSAALARHVALSELWEDPAPSPAELAQRCADQTICSDVPVKAGRQYAIWPRYSRDTFANGWPATQTPVLALNGTLDTQTPLWKARVVEDKLSEPHQHFVTVPFSSHGVVFNSPVKTEGAANCGAQLLRGFINDPEAALDTRCLDDLASPSFTASPEFLHDIFGASDLWDNLPPPAAGVLPPNQ